MGLVAIAITIAIVLGGQPWRAIAQPAAPVELRGVWLTNIDSSVLFSRRNLNQALERLARLHFNTVYPTVWNWGYTLYPSAVAETVVGRSQLPDRSLQGRDMLAEAVERGHELGLAVVPWFEFGLMAPAQSELVQRHPDWVTQRRDGTQVMMEGIHPRVWLNPAHPGVQRLIVDLVAELVGRYDVDGLQLDDHFGMPVDLGYDPYTVALYRQSHNGQAPPANAHDPEWMSWRASYISQLMHQVFDTVKAANSEAIVALSPNTREFSYQHYLQDWGTWERSGYVEELIVQVYRDNLDSFSQELQRAELIQVRDHIPVAVGVLAGLKNQITDAALLAQQVEHVRDRQLAGVSFFFYETLAGRDAMLQQMFPTPAQRPEVASANRTASAS